MGDQRTGDLLGRALGNHVTSPFAAFRTEVDDPVGRLDDVQVVLDDEHGIPPVHQPVEDVQQLADVVEVESRGRFVQQVDGLAGARPGEFLRQLDALRLAPRERDGRLAELDVVESHVVQGLEHAPDAGHVFEVFERLGHGHLQRVGDRLALVGHLQRLLHVTLPVADLAGHPHVRQEVHLDLPHAEPLAGLAAPGGHVEAEPAGLVPPHPGLHGPGEERPDRGEEPHVGGWIRPR